MKKVFIILQTLIFIKCFSQEIIFEKEIKTKFSSEETNVIYPSVNNKEIAIFLISKNNIDALLLDKEFHLIENKHENFNSGFYNRIIGSSLYNDLHHLYFINENLDKIRALSFSFDSSLKESNVINLDSKKESYLESFYYNDKFNIITIFRSSSILRIYTFNEVAKYDIHDFDLSKYKFSRDKTNSLYEALFEKHEFKFVPIIQKINNQNPNSIEIVSSINKLYFYNDKLFITIDNSYIDTKLIEVNLVDYKCNVRFYPQEEREIPEDWTFTGNSNSFLKDKYIFQILSSVGELDIRITEILLEKPTKRFIIKKNDKFDLNNTPFFLDGLSNFLRKKDTVEIEKTSRFLYQLGQCSFIGIPVYEYNNNFIITVGGYFVKKNNSMILLNGSPVGDIISLANYIYNPMLQSFRFSERNQSVYFKSILNKTTLEHEKGDVNDNIFDNIRKYAKTNECQVESMFKYEDSYIYIQFFSSNKTIKMIKFKE